MTRREIELIHHAMDEVHELQMSVEDRCGRKSILKRIDTIMGKLYELQYCDSETSRED